jgi:hypothetical protein
MKKEIRTVDETKRIVQVTTTDERWYVRESLDEKTGLPSYKYVPSVTWIAGHYPKGVGFYKWLADKGWNEAEAIKTAAGGKGSKVHSAISSLINGQTVEINAQFLNPSTGQLEELTVEEYDALASFVSWFKSVNPTVLSNEITVWSDKHNYAGTVDLVCNIAGQPWIIDIKTSAQVWPEYELQVSAYKHALELEDEPKLAILQVGYKRNKDGYKFTEVEDKFDLFRAAQLIWKNECSSQKPAQKDYPMSLSLHGDE